MTKQELIDAIDIDITNKTVVKSITPLNVGESLKKVLEFYESTDVLPEGLENLYFTTQRVLDIVTPLFEDLSLEVLGKQDTDEKGVADGYAPLNELAKISDTYLNFINDLTSGGTTSILSAEMGKELNELKQDIANISQDIFADRTETAKYPSVKAVYDYYNNLKVGAKNYFLNSKGDFSVGNSIYAESGSDGIYTYLVDKALKISFEIEVSGFIGTQNFGVRIYQHSATNSSYTSSDLLKSVTHTSLTQVTKETVYFDYTFVSGRTGSFYAQVRDTGATATLNVIRKLQAEIGDFHSDWRPNEADSEYVAPYKVFSAIVTATSPEAFTSLIVLENTIGHVGYSVDGSALNIESLDLFTSGKTVAIPTASSINTDQIVFDQPLLSVNQKIEVLVYN